MSDLPTVERQERGFQQDSDELLEKVFEIQDSGSRRERLGECGLLLDHIATIGAFERKFGSVGLSRILADKLQARIAHFDPWHQNDETLAGETELMFYAAHAVSGQRVKVITPEMHRDLTLLTRPGENRHPHEDTFDLYPTFGELASGRYVSRRIHGRAAVISVNPEGWLALQQRTARDMANAGIGEYATHQGR